MLFNSFQYFAFLGIVVPLFYVCPARHRWAVLLVASYGFYMCWNPVFILLLVGSTLLDYVCALKIAASPGSRRRRWLWLSLCGNLGLLGVFKYFNFFIASAAHLLTRIGIPYSYDALNIVLPIGISFYTLQTLGYTVDVYRSRLTPERHLGRFALYVAFFPQLVAGPIERASHLLPQLRVAQSPDLDRIASGLRLILWGLFKKVVIADRLAVFVNQVYQDPQAFSGSTLLLATYFFTFQIYCDFSGYTDIAVGTGRIFGINLTQNFRLPYLATSIQDFWHRWHISLTTWFRDYVYYPMGGSRTSRTGIWLRNVLIVFLVSGLWHGASWTFVVWGLVHALLYVGERACARFRSGVADVLSLPAPQRVAGARFATFHLVLLTWVFFRAETMEQAGLILSRMATDLLSPVFLGSSPVATVLSMMLILVLMLVQLGQSRHLLPLAETPAPLSSGCRWWACTVLVLAIAVLGQSNNAFIYFQF